MATVEWGTACQSYAISGEDKLAHQFLEGPPRAPPEVDRSGRNPEVSDGNFGVDHASRRSEDRWSRNCTLKSGGCIQSHPVVLSQQMPLDH